MTRAACFWPIEDIDVPLNRAIGAATLDLPRILAENHWVKIAEPTAWRTEEGVDQDGPRLFLRCEMDVLVVPRECREAG